MSMRLVEQPSTIKLKGRVTSTLRHFKCKAAIICKFGAGPVPVSSRFGKERQKLGPYRPQPDAFPNNLRGPHFPVPFSLLGSWCCLNMECECWQKKEPYSYSS